MTILTHDETSASGPNSVFQRQWRIYRKMVDNDYLFHRGAYGRLHQVLAEEVAGPFNFLDIACGDASATVAALKGTAVARYTGIDLSTAALELAATAVRDLACPTELRQADFAGSLAAWRQPVDIAWIGLSLHHFQAAGKRALMADIRRILSPAGRLLVYENASPDGEDRDGWLRRWDGQEASWTAYDPDEWATMTAHVHASDYPETRSTWRRLGHEAGFAEVEELFASPTDLFRLYSFRG